MVRLKRQTATGSTRLDELELRVDELLASPGVANTSRPPAPQSRTVLSRGGVESSASTSGNSAQAAVYRGPELKKLKVVGIHDLQISSQWTGTAAMR